MELSCDRCLARFSTSEEPVPGHTYRVPCVCGNTMVVESGDLGVGVRLLASAELELTRSTVDPFAPVPPRRNGHVEVTTRLDERRLAERDPDARADESAEYHVTGAMSFDDLLRRARAKGFLVGAAAGAVGAAAVAVALAIATARSAGTTTIPVREPPPAPVAVAEPAQEAAPAARGLPVPRREGVEVAPSRGPPGERPASLPGRPLPEAAVAEGETPAPAPARTAVPGSADAAPALAEAPAPAAAPAPPPPAGASRREPAAEGGGTTRATPGGGLEPAVASRPRRPFPEEEVAEALRARRAAVSDCIAATPGDASVARGHRFSLTVVIDPGGQVADASIDDPEVQETPLGVCLLRLARTMSFAPFEGAPYRVELALDYGDSR